MPLDMYPNPNKGLLGGVNILRAALTGSNDVSFYSIQYNDEYDMVVCFSSQIPQQYKNLGRQSKDKYDEQHAKLIHELIECDEFDDIATLKVINMMADFVSIFTIKCILIFRILENFWVRTHQTWKINYARLVIPSSIN